MYKIFSVAEANKLIPQVDKILRNMQETASDLNELQTFLNTAQPMGAKAMNVIQESRFLLTMLEGYGRELYAVGAHVKDLAKGHVVFPSRIGAEVVALCWEQGDDAIRYYQRVNQDTKYSLNAESDDPISVITHASDILPERTHTQC